MTSGIGPGLRALFSRQRLFKIEKFGGRYDDFGGNMAEVETADLNEAHVISSAVRPESGDLLTFDPHALKPPAPKPNLHIVVIDVDHPAHLVESSTPGHSHLYVEIPPVSWSDYAEWLKASEKIGLVQPGYVEATLRRGHSDVRLPWIWKDDPAAPVFGRDQTPAAESETCTIASPLECHSPTNREQLENLEMPF